MVSSAAGGMSALFGGDSSSDEESGAASGSSGVRASFAPGNASLVQEALLHGEQHVATALMQAVPEGLALSMRSPILAWSSELAQQAADQLNRVAQWASGATQLPWELQRVNVQAWRQGDDSVMATASVPNYRDLFDEQVLLDAPVQVAATSSNATVSLDIKVFSLNSYVVHVDGLPSGTTVDPPTAAPLLPGNTFVLQPAEVSRTVFGLPEGQTDTFVVHVQAIGQQSSSDIRRIHILLGNSASGSGSGASSNGGSGSGASSAGGSGSGASSNGGSGSGASSTSFLSHVPLPLRCHRDRWRRPP